MKNLSITIDYSSKNETNNTSVVVVCVNGKEFQSKQDYNLNLSGIMIYAEECAEDYLTNE